MNLKRLYQEQSNYIASLPFFENSDKKENFQETPEFLSYKKAKQYLRYHTKNYERNIKNIGLKDINLDQIQIGYLEAPRKVSDRKRFEIRVYISKKYQSDNVNDESNIETISSYLGQYNWVLHNVEKKNVENGFFYDYHLA